MGAKPYKKDKLTEIEKLFYPSQIKIRRKTEMQVKNGEITKTYGVISGGDLNKEVNLISWNGKGFSI